MHIPSHLGIYIHREKETCFQLTDNLEIFSAEIMLWFKEFVLHSFLIEINKQENLYVLCIALFWHCWAYDSVLRAICNVFYRQHSLLLLNEDRNLYVTFNPQILPFLGSLCFCGFFISGCSLPKLNILSFLASLCFYSFIYFRPVVSVSTFIIYLLKRVTVTTSSWPERQFSDVL